MLTSNSRCGCSVLDAKWLHYQVTKLFQFLSLQGGAPGCVRTSVWSCDRCTLSHRNIWMNRHKARLQNQELCLSTVMTQQVGLEWESKLGYEKCLTNNAGQSSSCTLTNPSLRFFPHIHCHVMSSAWTTENELITFVFVGLDVKMDQNWSQSLKTGDGLNIPLST